MPSFMHSSVFQWMDLVSRRRLHTSQPNGIKLYVHCCMFSYTILDFGTGVLESIYNNGRTNKVVHAETFAITRITVQSIIYMKVSNLKIACMV